MLLRAVQVVLVVAYATAVEKATNPEVGVYNPALDVSFCPIQCGRHSGSSNNEKVGQHVACRCNNQYVKTCLRYQEKSMADFRLAITIAHNKLRNEVAGGKRKGLPTASDMNAVSYSLALEYMAECSANSCKEEFIPCLRVENFQFVSQNQYLTTSKGSNKPSTAFIDEALTNWMNTIDTAPSLNIISEFKEGGKWEAASAMLWSSVQSIGCAINHSNSSIFIVCNYGSVHDMNFKGGRVYSDGLPCTQCKERTTCNEEFKHLCGEIKGVPIAIAGRPGLMAIFNISASGKYGTPLDSNQFHIRGNKMLDFLLAAILLVLHV